MAKRPLQDVVDAERRRRHLPLDLPEKPPQRLAALAGGRAVDDEGGEKYVPVADDREQVVEAGEVWAGARRRPMPQRVRLVVELHGSEKVFIPHEFTKDRAASDAWLRA